MTIRGISPEGCRAPRCGYLIENTVTIGGRTEADHRCEHDVPMHDGCAWHRTPEQIKAMHERDARLLADVKQPIQRRRGL